MGDLVMVVLVFDFVMIMVFFVFSFVVFFFVIFGFFFGEDGVVKCIDFQFYFGVDWFVIVLCVILKCNYMWFVLNIFMFDEGDVLYDGVFVNFMIYDLMLVFIIMIVNYIDVIGNIVDNNGIVWQVN